MTDDNSEWMSFHDAVAYVEEAQKCYEELAIRLLKQSVDRQEVASRTVDASGWIVSGDVYYPNNGKDLEFWREDVHRRFAKVLSDATRSSSSSARNETAVRKGICTAILELGTNLRNVSAKERNQQIHGWLRSKKIIGEHHCVTRSIQRVLKADGPIRK